MARTGFSVLVSCIGISSTTCTHKLKSIERLDPTPRNQFFSRDWKIKLASAWVPRGLETDALFHEAIYGRLESEIGKKFEDAVMKTLGGDELSQEARNAKTKQMNSLKASNAITQ
jgi:hypothetical protein